MTPAVLRHRLLKRRIRNEVLARRRCLPREGKDGEQDQAEDAREREAHGDPSPARMERSISTSGRKSHTIFGIISRDAGIGRRCIIHTGGATMPQEITPDRILQLGLGFWGPKTLLSA